jgi:uncharacterized membrane protein YhaH (DUF805 family)
MALKVSSLFRALFSFKGRIKRLDYWLSLIGLAVARVGVLILALTFSHMRMGETQSLPLRLGLDAAFLWPSASIVIKRGHDRNRSTLFSCGLVVVLYGLGVAFGLLMDLGHHEAGTLSLLVVLVGSFYMLIDYGMLDGTPGLNRYGPSPKGLPSAGVGEDLGKVFE